MNLAGLPFWQETEKRWKTQILRWCIGIGRNGEVRSRGKGRSQTQLGSKWGWGAGLKLITIWSDKANVTAATMVYLIGIELRLRIISACYAFRCIMESNHKSILTKAVRMCKAWMHCHVSLGSVPIAAFGAQSIDERRVPKKGTWSHSGHNQQDCTRLRKQLLSIKSQKRSNLTWERRGHQPAML